MSTVSSTSSSTINPYAIAYSTNDLMVTEDPYTASSGSSSKSSSTNSSSSSGSYSSGLVSSMSGIDVNSLVNEMMQSDQVKLNLLLQKQQTTQWTQDRYRSIITNLTDFKSTYFNVTSDDNMLSPSKYILNSAKSDNSAVTSTVSNDAAAGNYSISWTRLASAPKIDNVSGSVASLGLQSTSKATDLANAIGGTGSLSFTVNGKDVTYDLKSTANANKTIKQVMSDLSSQTGATFSYSELTGKITAIGSSTGSSQTLNLSWKQSDTDTAAFMNKAFGLTGGTAPVTSGTDGSGNAIYKYTATGLDGSFTISEPDGSSQTVTSSSNSLTYDGVTFNVTGKPNSTGTANITVATDYSGIEDKIKGFVDNYNNLIGAIQDALNEKSDSTYKPLTSAQESQMTTDQITKWNQKAQQGLLANDDTLNSMLTQMREALYSVTKGTGLTMADLGLATSDDPKQGGKLTFVKDASDNQFHNLENTLKTNPQALINAFTQTSSSVPMYTNDLSSTDVAKRYNEEGVFQRLSDIVEEYAGTYIDKNGNQGKLLIKAGSNESDWSEYRNTLYKELNTEKDDVTNFQTKMTNDKKMYTAKFTALQSALTAMSSQQSYISSMLSSYSSNS